MPPAESRVDRLRAVLESQGLWLARPARPRRRTLAGRALEAARAELRRVPGAEQRALRDRALVALLAFTGMRISEAVGSDVEDLVVHHGHSPVPVGRKGGVRQQLVVSPVAWQRVAAYLDDRLTGPLFLTRAG